MNNLSLLTKNFLKHRKNNCIIIAIVSITFMCCITILNVIKSHEQITVKQCYDAYGSYTVSIEDPRVFDKLDALQQERTVAGVFPLYSVTEEHDDKTYVFHYASEDIFSYMGFSLIDGSFPSNENEIAVERSYLFALGKHSDEMLNSTIVLPNREEAYTVTAIIQSNQTDSEDDTRNFIFCNPSGRSNRLLLQVTQIDAYESILDHLAEKYDLDKEQFYINFNLFFTFGLLHDDSIFAEHTKSYLFYFFIIALCSCISIFNLLNAFIHKVHSDIAIFHLIGLPTAATLLSFIAYLSILITAGIIIGIAASFFVIFPIISAFLPERLPLASVLKDARLDLLAITVAVYYVISWLSLSPLFTKMKCLTANHLIRSGYGPSVQKHAARSIFSFKKQNYIRTIAFQNLRSHKFNTFFNIIAIGFGVSVLVIGLFTVDLNEQAFGYTNNHSYKLSFPWDGDEEQICAFYETLSKQDGVRLYPEYVTIAPLRFSKEQLGSRYIDYLSSDINNDVSFGSSFQSNFSVDTILIGYNQTQLDLLWKRNGLAPQSLADNQAIVLNTTLPLRGREGFSLQLAAGAELAFGQYYESTAGKSLSICRTVDRLSTYPTGYYNKPCVIVNEATFKRLTEIAFPDALYIDPPTGGEEALETLIAGNNFYTVTIPAEQEQLLAKTNETLQRVSFLFFCIIIITVLSAMFSSVYVRIELSEREYISYQSIGISRQEISKITLCELSALYLLSMTAAALISLSLCYYFYTSIVGEIGKYLYAFPWSLYFLAVVVVACLFTLCSRPIINRLSKISLPEYLKANH